MDDTRLQRIQRRLADEGLDTLMVTDPSNKRYLTGFTGSGALLISKDRVLLAAGFIYYEQARLQSPGIPLFKLEKSLQADFGALVAAMGSKQIAFENTHMTLALLQELSTACNVELVPVKGWVEDLRVVKTPDELALIRAAVAISDAAVAALPELIGPGMTERQLAWALEAYMYTHGADQVAFPTLVGCGPICALPHAIASDRPLVPGQSIVMDLGARIEGYCSDLTRTICLGQPDEKLREVHATVLAAQQAAEAAIRPGLLGKEVDAIGRQVVVQAGYGAAFGHGLGHGVGIDVHERPSTGFLSEDRLQPGMVVTIEPGIYLPGWGGVRIEDVVLVTESGAEILTKAARDLTQAC